MSAYHNRKYLTNNTPSPLSTNHRLMNILCQQRCGFQLIYLESYAYLLGFETQTTHKTLIKALCYKLTQSKLKITTLNTLNTELLETSATISSKNKHLRNARLHYYNAYYHDHKDQTAVKLHHLLQDVLTSKTTEQINDLKVKLHQQTIENPSNFWIAFDMAWIYFHIDGDIQKAEQLLTQAANNALQEESPLATLILRYLAYAKLLLGKNKEALTSMQAIMQHSPLEQENPHSIFESVQFHHLVDDSYKQQIILQKLIRQYPLYYLYTQIDECLHKHKNIQNLLLRFHQEKLTQIKKSTHEQWQATHFYQAELPEEFNKNELLENNFKFYQALLSHQTYPVLCDIETISTKIVAQLSAIANKQLTMAHTRYVKKIIETQKQWKTINKLGGILLYAAVIISFASILLWISAVVMNAPILTEIDWKKTLPKMIMMVSFTAFLGLLLMRSTPPSNRKRLKYTQLINHALKGASSIFNKK